MLAPDACTPASCNGTTFGTGALAGQVVSLTAFSFPVEALPTQLDREHLDGNGAPYVAGTADFLLVR